MVASVPCALNSWHWTASVLRLSSYLAFIHYMWNAGNNWKFGRIGAHAARFVIRNPFNYKVNVRHGLSASAPPCRNNHAGLVGLRAVDTCT